MCFSTIANIDLYLNRLNIFCLIQNLRYDMIHIKQNGRVYEISFRYDPTIVHLIKQVPQKQWVSESKHWTIPVEHLGLFINQIKGTVYENQVVVDSEEHIGENSELETSTAIPDIDISNVPFYVKKGCEPYKHQIDFMKIKEGEWGAINFNNMIPVHESCLHKVEMKILSSDSIAEIAYKNLLSNQLSWCDSHSALILKQAAKLYAVITEGRAWGRLAARCCDFALDERRCLLYGVERGTPEM